MKTKLTPALIRLAALLLLLSAVNYQLSTCAQGTAFTYQGQLEFQGGAANGSFDLTFSLWNGPVGPTQIGGAVTNLNVTTSNGLVAVTLDFGSGVFTGPDRWLEIAVRTNGGGVFTTLAPRQQLTPTPYAIFAGGASNLSGALPATQLSGTLGSNQLSGVYSSAITLNNSTNSFSGNGTNLSNLNAANITGGTLADARLSANVALLNNSQTFTGTKSFTSAANNFLGSFAGTFSGNGVGLTNINATNFWRLTGNSGTVPGTQFLGTTDNQALELKVNGSRALRLEPNTSAAPNFIGGSVGNFVFPGVVGATISGGGATNYILATFRTNAVYSDFATIGGGAANIVSNAPSGTVAGGRSNEVEGDDAAIVGGLVNRIRNSDQAFIGGGNANLIQSGAIRSAIVGGWDNLITTGAEKSVIGGGEQNEVHSRWSVVAGGLFSVIPTNSDYCTVGGGTFNGVSFDSQFCTVGGGSHNIAGGVGATVPGGVDNHATGDTSFAAGNQATASHDGTFVWSDATGSFDSTKSNQFLIHATSGVGINTNNPLSALHVNGSVNVTSGDLILRTGGQLLADGGSNNAPGISFQGDSNTGIVHPIANTLAFVTTGAEQMRINSGGDVGIGTNTPAAVLHVNGTTRIEGNLTTATNVTVGALFALSRVTLVPANNSTITPTASYLLLNPTGLVTLNGTTAIANGSTTGTILILEGTDDLQSVTINNGANTSLAAASRVLGNDDTLMLMWNGADWIELSFSNN